MTRKNKDRVVEWPAWYVPRTDADGIVHAGGANAGKQIACFFRKDKHSGRTYLVDGSSFVFGDWYADKPTPAMVSKEYAMSRITHREPKQ